MKQQDLHAIEFLALLKDTITGLRAVSQDNVNTAKQVNAMLATAEEIEERKLRSIEAQRLEIEAIKKAIENIRNSSNPSSPDNQAVLRQLEQERKQKEAQYGTTMGQVSGKDIAHSVQDWTIMANTLTDAINRWIDFNTRMQIMQMDAVKTGWENISAGQTPYMSKTIGMMSDYTRKSLEIQADQQKANLDIIGKVAGVIVGVGVGAFTGGIGGVGAGITTMSLISGFTSAIMAKEQAEQEERINKFNLYTGQHGQLNQMQNSLRTQKLGIVEYLSSGGKNFDTSNIMGTRGELRSIEDQYAGIQGFGMDEITRTMQMIGMSKQFSGGDQKSIMENIKLTGKTTGLGEQEILNYMTELRVRLSTPLENLSSTIGELADISEKFKMPLKQVMSDFLELARINQKYGYSQDQLTGLYTEFIDEVKKGTISMGDFQKFLEGMSQTSTDKAIGIGALLKGTSLEKILTGVSSEDKGGVSKLHGMIGGMQDADIGVFLKMASQPNADKNPFMQQVMDKYGITQDDLSSVQSSIPKALLGLSFGYGKEGGAGIGQLIFEAFGNLTGLGLSNDYYTQGLQTKGIGTLGKEGAFSSTGLKGNIEQMSITLQQERNRLIEEENKIFDRFVPIIEKYNSSLSTGKDIMSAFTDVVVELSDEMKKVSEEKLAPLMKLLKGEDDGKTTITEDIWSIVGAGKIGGFDMLTFTELISEGFKNLSNLNNKSTKVVFNGTEYDVNNKDELLKLLDKLGKGGYF